MKLGKLAVAVAAIVAIGSAQASIIDNGTYTTDTVSGLDWLDVTRTAGMSFNTVLSEIAVGGTLYGWRYATADQLAELVNGLPITYTSNIPIPSVSSYARVTGSDRIILDGLTTSLGITFSNSIYASHDRVNGLTADAMSTNSPYHYISTFESVDHNLAGYHFSQVSFRDSYQHSTLSNESVGSFLVRDTAISPVPAPPAVILMLAGLGLLGLTKRFRKEVG